MKLLKSITLVAFLFSVTTSCAQWGKWEKVKGNGNITTENRSTGDYDGLKSAGPMNFKLIQGKEGNITIEGDSNLMEHIVTKVEGGKLVVKVEDGVNIKPSKTIVVTIPYESINSVSLAGSGDIENSGTIKSNNFDVSIAGSGDINLKISSNTVESNIAGSGDIELSGSTKDLTTKITGSGDFDGSDLDSTNVTAKITGSGGANVVCNGELKVRITGSGDVKYSGKPTNKDTKVTGSGSVSN
ncbi:head GIN domain-containing protein [uncultured Winogradskyella sp.]|uniref:head GIN domain-containing protein n=1 Tax=uncultured Winogradskyella sp. TaxID=395353 RepID=UPI002627FEB8|nr:head GIN domain-containing protein [uncultured Winogradskyella sp.]